MLLKRYGKLFVTRKHLRHLSPESQLNVQPSSDEVEDVIPPKKGKGKLVKGVVFIDDGEEDVPTRKKEPARTVSAKLLVVEVVCMPKYSCYTTRTI